MPPHRASPAGSALQSPAKLLDRFAEMDNVSLKTAVTVENLGLCRILVRVGQLVFSRKQGGFSPGIPPTLHLNQCLKCRGKDGCSAWARQVFRETLTAAKCRAWKNKQPQLKNPFLPDRPISNSVSEIQYPVCTESVFCRNSMSTWTAPWGGRRWKAPRCILVSSFSTSQKKRPRFFSFGTIHDENSISVWGFSASAFAAASLSTFLAGSHIDKGYNILAPIFATITVSGKFLLFRITVKVFLFSSLQCRLGPFPVITEAGRERDWPSSSLFKNLSSWGFCLIYTIWQPTIPFRVRGTQ